MYKFCLNIYQVQLIFLMFDAITISSKYLDNFTYFWIYYFNSRNQMLRHLQSTPLDVIKNRSNYRKRDFDKPIYQSICVLIWIVSNYFAF